FEKMAEDHLYWALVDARWFDEANFAKGPKNFFQKIPAPVRPIMVAFVQRRLKRTLYGQGMGRHTGTEIVALGTRSIAAIADFLGSKPFFMGGEPTGADATMFAFVAGVLCPHFDTPLRTAAQHHENLRRYVGRPPVTAPTSARLPAARRRRDASPRSVPSHSRNGRVTFCLPTEAELMVGGRWP